MAALKLTLDGDALHRLLGGNTETEIELRNCIVQEFAKKHLKGLANDRTLGEMLKAEFASIKPEIERQIALQVGRKKNSWSSELELTPGLVSALNAKVTSVVNTELNKAVSSIQTTIDSRIKETLNGIDTYIDSRIAKITQAYIDQKVKDRITAVMAAA